MNTDQPDILSQKARETLRLNAAAAYQSLVPVTEGSVEARAHLELLDPDSTLHGRTVNRTDSRAMLAGLWLWHDFLTDSHELSQQIDTPNGSFWHAIMHRREGDFSNSKYWLNRCRNHSIFPTLAVRADDLIRSHPADKSIFRLTSAGWNAEAFVDLVESVHNKPGDARRALVVSLQQLEWRLLFDHCTRGAAVA